MVKRHSESVIVLSNFAVGSRRFQDILADRAGFQRVQRFAIQRYKNITEYYKTSLLEKIYNVYYTYTPGFRIFIVRVPY
jgi:hypothetical protein